MRPTLKPNMAPSVIPSTVTSPKSASMGGLSTSRFAPRASNSREATPTAGKPKAAINGDTEASVFKSDLTNIRNLVTCSICDQLLYEPWTLSCGKYSSHHFLPVQVAFLRFQGFTPITSQKRICLESLLPSSRLTPFLPDKVNTDTVKKGHTYCYSCLCNWFVPNKRKKTCPECRTAVKQMPAPAFLVSLDPITFIREYLLTLLVR